MDFKDWWKSKTLWGALVVAVSFILQLLGKTISPDQQSILTDQLTTIATAVGEVVGIIIVVVGRFMAKTAITKPK